MEFMYGVIIMFMFSYIEFALKSQFCNYAIMVIEAEIVFFFHMMPTWNEMRMHIVCIINIMLV